LPGFGWRRDRAQLRAYTEASCWWIGMFVMRVVAQLPLYLAGAAAALGVVNLAMNAPLTARSRLSENGLLPRADVGADPEI
jgi:hypothetical protein